MALKFQIDLKSTWTIEPVQNRFDFIFFFANVSESSALIVLSSHNDSHNSDSSSALSTEYVHWICLLKFNEAPYMLWFENKSEW